MPISFVSNLGGGSSASNVILSPCRHAWQARFEFWWIQKIHSGLNPGWGWFTFGGPQVGARQARANLGLWDGIPLGFKGNSLKSFVPSCLCERKPDLNPQWAVEHLRQRPARGIFKNSNHLLEKAMQIARQIRETSCLRNTEGKQAMAPHGPYTIQAHPIIDRGVPARTTTPHQYNSPPRLTAS